MNTIKTALGITPTLESLQGQLTTWRGRLSDTTSKLNTARRKLALDGDVDSGAIVSLVNEQTVANQRIAGIEGLISEKQAENAAEARRVKEHELATLTREPSTVTFDRESKAFAREAIAIRDQLRSLFERIDARCKQGNEHKRKVETLRAELGVVGDEIVDWSAGQIRRICGREIRADDMKSNRMLSDGRAYHAVEDRMLELLKSNHL